MGCKCFVAAETRDEAKFCINEFIKLKGLVSNYSSTANPITSANIAVGALYMTLIIDPTSGTLEFDWQSRLRFYDN